VSRAIRLLRLRVENVGTLRGPIEIGPFAPGINVISGSNEAGKSTLVEALKLGLFERHGTKNKGVMALQPHGTKLAPEVEIVLDLEGEQIQVMKRFIDKPMSELRLSNGAIFKANDADDYLRAKLEGKAPKKSGLVREDMGVWGLLWVTQDESAHEDPGDRLDEEVRGALADAVSRQVGQVMGGKHGERIRGRIHEELKKYYTPKTDKPTGEYKEALDRKQAADALVVRIEGAVREVEDLALQLEAQRARLEEAERQLPAFKAERDDAHRQVSALQQKEAQLRETKARAVAAEALVTKCRYDLRARTGLAEDVATLDVNLQRGQEKLGEMAGFLRSQEQEVHEAREALRQADDQLSEKRQALESLRQQLAQAFARSEALRISGGLAQAETIAFGIAEVDRARAVDGIDQKTYEQIEELSARVDALRAKLALEGTRIVDRNAAQVWIGTGAAIDVPRLGRVELVPAQPGLAQAVVLAKEARAALKEGLFGLGVGDVQGARERYAARKEIEREAETLRHRLKQLAPAGIDDLAVRGSKAVQDKSRLEEHLASSIRAQEALDRVRENLAKHSIDKATIQVLRNAEREVELARESRTAMGTALLIRAISDVTVSVSDNSSSVNLCRGQTIERQITRPTTVVLGDTAELVLTPRGEDLARASARLESAERELASAFRVHGVDSLEQAETMAQVRDELARKKSDVEQRLAELAPRGIDKLRADVEHARQETQAIETQLVSARDALTRQAEVEVQLAANLVGLQKLERILALEKDVITREGMVKQKSARLRGISGLLSEHEIIVSEPMPLNDPANGSEWTVIPGESSDWVHLDKAHRALDEAFQRAQILDIGAARERYATSRDLASKRERLVEQIKLIAPAGLDALRGRQRAMAAAIATEQSGMSHELSAEELQHQIDALAADIAPLNAEQTVLKERAISLEKNKDTCAHQVGELRGRWIEQTAQFERLANELAANRKETQDSVLREKLDTASADLVDAKVSEERASVDLAAATPELLQDEVKRAQFALDTQEGHLRKLRDDVIRLQALLAKAASEGQFEELSEAKAEQEAAAELLAGVERHARATRILSELTEDAYTDAQRIFLEPVLKEAAPYLSRLRPGTEIRMTPDLRLDKVVRQGMEEDFGQLSGGTREQLSVIVRIALARVFAKDRRPLPLILDDTMGWTDDARFVSMVKILRDASKELQIIILTCHGTRFDRLQPDFRVDLDELRRNAVQQ
jgi:uncharacterized protein YhaN